MLAWTAEKVKLRRSQSTEKLKWRQMERLMRMAMV